MFEFVAQGADGDAENIGGMGAVAEAIVERVEDQFLLDGIDRAPDQPAGIAAGGSMADQCLRRARVALSVGFFRSALQQDGIGFYLRAGGQQHATVHRIFQLAHVARPVIPRQLIQRSIA